MNILILGAGPGLSRAIAELFGKKDFHVTLVSRNEEKLRKEISYLKSKDVKADFIVGDVSKEKNITDIIEKTINESGLPDVIVYNAFTNISGDFDEESWEHLKEQLDVNVGGAFYLLKKVIPLYKKIGKGNLFFTGGGLGINPMPEYLGIGMSKATLKNMVEAASLVMKETDVHVAVVTVTGIIGGEDPKYSPSKIAENYWKLYKQEKPDLQTEIIY